MSELSQPPCRCGPHIHLGYNDSGLLAFSEIVAYGACTECECKRWESSDDDRVQLIEILAAVEHERWAKWQSYLHSRCTADEDGNLTIPSALADRWLRQIQTPYWELSEAEKDSDRAEAIGTLAAIEGSGEWRVVWLNPEGITA